MELNLLRVIVAAFLGTFGLLIDFQSILAGIAALRKGRGPQPVRYWPLCVYAAAVLMYPGAWSARSVLFLIGLVFHAVSTVGVKGLFRS